MSDFNGAVQYVINNEGGLQQSSSDPGGLTNLGISLRFIRSLNSDKLKKYGFSIDPHLINRVDIEQLTIAQAKEIYRHEYWNHAPFDRIHNQNVCNYLFDSAVNMGISPAIKCIQRATWAVTKTKGIILDDGILGEESIILINQCGAFLILPAMRSERAGEYRLFAEKNPSSQEYLDGWLSRSYNQEDK